MPKQHVITVMRDRGYRMTKQRIALLDTLWAFDGHFTADTLQDALRHQGQSVDLSTIYRTLDLLTELDVLQHLHGTSPAQYERMVDTTHHHLICERCGYVDEVADSHLGALYEHLRQEHNFVARLNHLAIPGLCLDCSMAAEGGVER